MIDLNNLYNNHYKNKEMHGLGKYCMNYNKTYFCTYPYNDNNIGRNKYHRDKNDYYTSIINTSQGDVNYSPNTNYIYDYNEGNKKNKIEKKKFYIEILSVIQNMGPILDMCVVKNKNNEYEIITCNSYGRTGCVSIIQSGLKTNITCDRSNFNTTKKKKRKEKRKKKWYILFYLSNDIIVLLIDPKQ